MRMFPWEVDSRDDTVPFCNKTKRDDWCFVMDGNSVTRDNDRIHGVGVLFCACCGLKYHEVKYKWRTENIEGCSKCGAPKGEM